MRTATLVLAVTVSTGLVLPLTAQETEAPGPPQFLMVASYVCPMGAIADIARSYETYTKPVEQEMVAEGGVLASAGLYFHFWSDEWNVNYFRLGYDAGDMLAAAQTVNQRVLERNPELRGEPGPFAACTAHKDNIYGFGPGTGRPDVFTQGSEGN
jgi:hypothetical protein